MNNSSNPYFTESNCTIDNAEVRQKIDQAKQASLEKLLEGLKINKNN
jgi:hypothetical protein